MATPTIDQLKKSLREQGIALPPAGSKKADYVKLYEQYSTLNENLGDFYSSDDENPPRNSSHHVSSSTSPSKIENIMREVEKLTDDELYNQLKELGASIGPVLENTRKVYEKKLVKLLGGGGSQKNGIDASPKTASTFKVDEFSDSEVELPSVKTTYNKRLEQKESSVPRSPRKSSVNRESPKPRMEEPVPDPVIERKFTSRSYSEMNNAVPSFSNYETNEETSKASKFSFIERVPKGSSYRFIEHAMPPTEVDYPSASMRSRFNTDKPSLGQSDYYTGTWEPNTKKYFAPQSQPKITKRATTPSLTTKSAFKENLIAVAFLVLFILFLLYLYIYHWSAADPYKEIEDDADRELEYLTARNMDSKSNTV